MSHFTHIITRFQNLFYLEKALNKLNISYEKQRKVVDGSKALQKQAVICSCEHLMRLNWQAKHLAPNKKTTSLLKSINNFKMLVFNGFNSALK